MKDGGPRNLKLKSASGLKVRSAVKISKRKSSIEIAEKKKWCEVTYFPSCKI